MKIAYFGSPSISANLLSKLIRSDFEISLVVTQPDKPRGKRLLLSKTDVHAVGERNAIPVFDKDLGANSNEEVLLRVLTEKNIQLCIVFAYGKILSEKLIHSVPYGFWNVHPSLLPLYRGPCPIHYPIFLGDARTGVTIIRMNKYMDKGGILSQESIPINLNDSRTEIENTLVDLSHRMLVQITKNPKETLSLQRRQNERGCSYTKLLSRNDGFVKLELIDSAIRLKPLKHFYLPNIVKAYLSKHPKHFTPTANIFLYNFYRAMNPWPGVWTMVDTNSGKKRLKINSIRLKKKLAWIETVQLEGKKEVSFEIFNKAYNIYHS